MKKIKKIVFLVVIVVITIIYLIYNNMHSNYNEVIEENPYVNEYDNYINEKNKIVLHITGEVRIPRDYRN